MKAAFLLCALICSISPICIAQKTTDKTVKVKNIHYPLVSVKEVQSYKVVIHNGAIPVNLAALKEKKGLRSKMMAWQDDINNKTPDYYSYTNYKLNAANPDVTIEFTFGPYKESGKATKDHKIPCVVKGQKISKETVKECPAYYYEFTYTLPYVLRITDKSGKVLLNEHHQEQATQTFGYDASGMSGFLKIQELQDAYRKAIESDKNQFAEKALVSKLEESEEKIQEAFYFSAYTQKFDIASAAGKGFDYSALDQAQTIAISGFEKVSKGDATTGRTDLEKAIATWKKEVSELNLGSENARINRKIGTFLYRNITYAYLHLWELDSAGTYLSEWSRLAKFSSNLNRVEETVEVSATITKRKEMLTAYKSNRDVTGTQLEAVNLLEAIRVKQKDATYNPLTNQDNYAARTENFQKKEENTQANVLKNLFGTGTNGEAGTNGKDNRYQDRVQRTSFQGYTLMISRLIDGKMDSLPAEICNISYLNELNVSNNSLKYIPSDISKMKDLKKLHLNNNQLTSLPSEIGQLANLKMLNVKGNSIPKDQIESIQKMLPGCNIKY